LRVEAAGSDRQGEDSSEVDGSNLSLNDAHPHFGETVTFTLRYPAMQETARVRVLCYWNDVWVYQNAQPEGVGASFPGETGAEAKPTHCTADLFYFTCHCQGERGDADVATTLFDVAA
jgi:hypothetical protein